MPGGFLSTIALIGMVAVAIMFVFELRRWRMQGPVTGRAHRVLRVSMVVLIEALFALMIAGPAVTSSKDPVSALIYWTVCLAVGMAVIVLALIDFRNVVEQYGRLHRRLFRDLTRDDERKQ